MVIDLSPPSPPAKRPTRRSNAKTGTDNDKSSGPFSSHQPDAHIDNIDEFSAMQLNEVTPSIAARVAEKRRSSNGPFTTDPLHITTLEIEEHGVKRKRQHELKLSKNECEKVFCIGREIDENDFALPSDESVSGR